MICKYCGTNVDIENAKFCYECSGVLREENYEGILGIEITKEDITEYIITGRLRKVISVGNHIKAEIQTLTTGEHKEINRMVDTATSQMTSKPTYDMELKHHLLAFSICAINGNVWPTDIEKKLKLAESLGSEIAEILINRINYLHLAVGSKIQLRDF